MTRLLFILMFTTCILNNAKADTITYWHVYYNNIKIKEYNQYSTGELVLKMKKIKQTDSLTVFYFRDTPCSQCETQLIIENQRQIEITKGKGLGTFNPIKISIYDLLQEHIKADKDSYEALYQEGQITEKWQRVSLFKIKFK